MAHRHWQGLFLQPAATSTMHCQPEGCTHPPPPPSSPHFSVLQAMESWTGPGNKDKVNWKRFYPINASVVAMVNFFFSIYARISWEDDKVFMWPIFLKINEWAVVYVKEFRCYAAKIEQVKRLAVAGSRTQDTSATEPQQPDNHPCNSLYVQWQSMHWRLKPEVFWVQLPVTAGFSSIFASKFLYFQHEARCSEQLCILFTI